MTNTATSQTDGRPDQEDVDRLARRSVTEIQGVLGGTWTYDSAWEEFRPLLTVPTRCDCSEIDHERYPDELCDTCSWVDETPVDFAFWASMQDRWEPFSDGGGMFWLNDSENFLVWTAIDMVRVSSRKVNLGCGMVVQGLEEAVLDYAGDVGRGHGAQA